MGGDLLCPASEAMQKVASVPRRGPTGSHLILPLPSVGIQGAKQRLTLQPDLASYQPKSESMSQKLST